MTSNHYIFQKMRRIRLITGIILILAGILISFLLAKFQYDDCAYCYLNGLNAFDKKYASVWECFISRSKGWILISVIVGSIPLTMGCRLLMSNKQAECEE